MGKMFPSSREARSLGIVRARFPRAGNSLCRITGNGYLRRLNFYSCNSADGRAARTRAQTHARAPASADSAAKDFNYENNINLRYHVCEQFQRAASAYLGYRDVAFLPFHRYLGVITTEPRIACAPTNENAPRKRALRSATAMVTRQPEMRLVSIIIIMIIITTRG